MPKVPLDLYKELGRENDLCLFRRTVSDSLSLEDGSLPYEPRKRQEHQILQ